MSEHDDLDPALEDRARSLLTLAADTVPVATFPVAPEPRRPVWPWLAAAAAVAVIAVGLPLLLGSPPRTPAPQPPEPTTGTVPQTLWMTEEQAVATLEDAGYRVELSFPLTCKVEPGRVVNTDPTASESYAPGRAVLVRVARNPPTADCVYGNDDALGLLDLGRFGTGDLRFAPEVDVYVDGVLTRSLTAAEASDPSAWGDPSPLTRLVAALDDMIPAQDRGLQSPSVWTTADDGGQFACGENDPPVALAGRPSLLIQVQDVLDGPVGACQWFRTFRGSDGRIDAVTSASIGGAEEPASEESGPPEASTELRQYADAFATFAASGAAPAFAPEVRLLLGNRLVDTVTASEATDPATWLLPCEVYGEASCPIDALLPLRERGAYAVTGTIEREYDACHQVDARLPDDLVTPAVLARSVSLSVPEPEMCAQNWELQLWYDAAGAVRAANFIGGTL